MARRARLHVVGESAEDLVEERIHVDARRDDLVARAALLDPDEPFDRTAAAELAHGSDAVGHPQLQYVVGRHLLLVRKAVQMHVSVDEAGQDVVAGEIDLIVATLCALARVDGAGRADGTNLGDPVLRQHEVIRSLRGRARSVDDDHVAQHDARIRPRALSARRNRIVDRRLRGPQRAGEQQRQPDEGWAHADHP